MMEYIYEMPQAMLCDTPFKGEVKRFLYDAGTYDGGVGVPAIWI